MSLEWQLEMIHPEAFESIVNHLLDDFTGTEKKHDGDCAIAKLYRELEGQSPMAVELDILYAYARPEGPVALALADYYASYRVAIFLNNAYSLDLITRARLLLQFDSAGEAEAPISADGGIPYHCKLTITICDGRVFTAERVGRMSIEGIEG